jgi:hypothetical protein
MIFGLTPTLILRYKREIETWERLGLISNDDPL